MSSLLETFATAVGAGIVLGSFVVGVVGLFAHVRPTRDQLLDAGYIGGLAAIVSVLMDASSLIVR